jgi:hypothetical protein
VAAGLAAAHAAGLVHRDVKPANIWLDGGTGRARVLDFGLARLAGGGDGLTRAGAVLGTPEYMSPEQAAGGTVDHRSDVFSLGVVLYELATGARPFAGDSVMAVLTALAVRHPPPADEVNPAVPAALSRLIGRMLAKAAAERPATAAEVGEALAGIEASLAAVGECLPGSVDPGAATRVASGAVDLWGDGRTVPRPAPEDGRTDPPLVVAVLGVAFGGLSVLASTLAFLSPPGVAWIGASLAASVAALSCGLAAVRGAVHRQAGRGRVYVWLGLGLGSVGPAVWGVLLHLGYW